MSFYNTSGQLIDQQKIDKHSKIHTEVPGLYFVVLEGSFDGQNYQFLHKGKVVIQPQ